MISYVFILCYAKRDKIKRRYNCAALAHYFYFLCLKLMVNVTGLSYDRLNFESPYNSVALNLFQLSLFV